jgi:transposase-like protein
MVIICYKKVGEKMTIKPELLDEILKDYKQPEDFTGKDGIWKQLQKALIERMLEGEMTNTLGYSKNSKEGDNSGNSRNGKAKKTIQGDFGTMEIEVPRDRNGDFEPQLIKKGQRRFTGFDDKIISMYALGMSTRDIQGHLKEIYSVEVSPELISDVTAEILKEVVEWQSRPLDQVYPIVFFDALVVKIKDGGHIKNKAVYLALGVNMEGNKELLGMWIEETEGAKFWLKVMTELSNRGLKDIFIACVDGLKGFEEAIHSVYPKSEVQLCIVHMVRNSVKFVPYKDKKAVVGDLRSVYQAKTVEEAQINLELFKEKWDSKYQLIGKSWESNWSKIIPFFAYSPDIRKAIYTTNAIESMNMSIRKVIKTKSSFPNDEAALKLLYMALKNISKKWTMPIRDWGNAINQFSILFGDRVSGI